jgi:erythromycin esterase-like protein
MELIGESRFVLLGEASHGTHEFYRERARITQRLIKEKGFTAVAAEADWPDAYRVNRYEALFHSIFAAPFLLTWDANGAAKDALRDPRLERAIGVIYRPETERMSHYFRARLPEQFDAVLHFDATRAVEPLEYTSEWEAGEVPETFPFAV